MGISEEASDMRFIFLLFAIQLILQKVSGLSSVQYLVKMDNPNKTKTVYWLKTEGNLIKKGGDDPNTSEKYLQHKGSDYQNGQEEAPLNMLKNFGNKSSKKSKGNKGSFSQKGGLKNESKGNETSSRLNVLECENGKCLRTVEGKSSCVNMISWTGKADFKKCHNKCVWIDEKCDGKCAEDQCESKDGKCRDIGESENDLYKSCHGKCLMSYLKCDGKCAPFQCDNNNACQSIIPQYKTGHVQWGTCNGKCTFTTGNFQTKPCDGICETLPGFTLSSKNQPKNMTVCDYEKTEAEH